MNLDEYLILSDIHIDFWASRFDCTIDEALEKVFWQYPKKKKLICAGDIGNCVSVMKRAYSWFNEHFEETYIVLGNHDMIKELGNTWYDKIGDIRECLSKLPKVHLLDGNVVNDIGGCFGYYSAMCQFTREDEWTTAYYIWKNSWFDGAYWDVDNMDIKNFANKSKEMLVSMLEKKPKVLITHTIPIEIGIPTKFIGSKTNDYFYFKSADILEENLKNDLVWVCGHTHEKLSNEYTTKSGFNVKFICNPLGYPFENNELYNP